MIPQQDITAQQQQQLVPVCDQNDKYLMPDAHHTKYLVCTRPSAKGDQSPTTDIEYRRAARVVAGTTY